MRDDGDDGGCDGFGAVKIRERHYDPVHDEVNGDTVEYARNDWAVNHESELPAGKVKNGGGCEGDQEVEREAERGGGHSAFK